ncbi:MAG: adenine deaminase C-terminal domain-containing protein, partial [Candidatus Gracilibacteria bacterium]
DICEAVNLVIKNKGGLAVVGGGIKQFLALPIAGLMSDQNGYLVAKKYSLLSHEVKKLGSKLHAPFMTLAFMALLVIPKLKLSDKGLFDGEKFKFIQGGFLPLLLPPSFNVILRKKQP